MMIFGLGHFYFKLVTILSIHHGVLEINPAKKETPRLRANNLKIYRLMLL